MQCQRCATRPASIQVSRTINGQKQRANICNACAEELGVQTFESPFSGFAGFPGFNDFFDQPSLARGEHAHTGFTAGSSERASQYESVNILDAFSERAKSVVQTGAKVAVELESPMLDTEHLLIGVASEEQVGRQILENLDIKPDDLVAYLKENTLKNQRKYEEGVTPELSPRAKQSLELAWHSARNLQHEYVGSEHILIGLLEEGEGLASQTLKKYGITPTKLRQAVLSAVGEKGKKTGSAKKQSKTPTLDKYSRDLTELAREGRLDPVIGRSDEVQRVVQILSRRTKNNPVLIGEPGTGKTAIVEGLASRIVNKNVPETLADKRVLSLDLPAMVAGTKYRGEFEDRIKKVVDEVIEAKGLVILFIDELHTVVGAGGGGEGGSMDAANILKPALARGELQMLGATTLNEYKKHIEKDGALERRFQPVYIEEPSIQDAISILRGLKDKYEAHHKVIINDEAVVAAVTLSDKYLRDRFLPDKAIDLMDEASAKVRLSAMEEPVEITKNSEEIRRIERELSANKGTQDVSNKKSLEKELKEIKKRNKELEENWKKKSGTANVQVYAKDIESIIASWTGIPLEKITESEKEKLLHLEDELHKRVIAQDEAISAVSEAIRRNRAGLKDPKRPQGSFLFLGPTGVGKTELTKALASLIFGSEDSMIRLDMSEYMEKHAVARMIGSPPGYVGHEEGGQLTEKVRRRPYSVILLDEIEKAHPDVFNILLQVLEDGRLTDGKGRIVDFKNTLIIMTSNLGSSIIQQAVGKTGHDWEDVKKSLMEKLKETFRPELINRIDEVIVFHSLEKKHVQEIADILLKEVQRRVTNQGTRLEISEEVRNRLAQEGFDPEYGARPLRREIQRQLENKLSTALLTGQFKKGQTMRAVLKGEDIAFEPVTSASSKIA